MKNNNGVFNSSLTVLVWIVVIVMSSVTLVAAKNLNPVFTTKVGRSTDAASGTESGEEAEAAEMIWTRWGAGHYALADDGDSIWIGTASGLIRLDKISGDYTRIGTADGLPHRDVYAVVVDGLGNRWFGGNGGLSRLDTAEEWTTYNTINSGIYSNDVEDIAAAAGGTVWLSHLFEPNISELRPDGTWVVYADRKTAVESNYTAIKQTVNKNDLWTVSGGDIWIGYENYDGASWHAVIPPVGSSLPDVVDADSNGKVWFLSGYDVLAWDGAIWEEYPFFGPFDGYPNTLVVGEENEVWIGWQERDGFPYANHSAGISRVPDEPGYIEIYPEESLSVPPPVAVILPTEGGLWATGPNWLLWPNGSRKRFPDEPYYENVDEVVVDKLGRTWLHSYFFWPYTEGAMQTLDDKGTAIMADDEGMIWDGSRPSILRALEPAANGDLWVAWESDWRFRSPGRPLRYRWNDVIDYSPPSFSAYINDIFIQDSQHAWFTYTGNWEKGVWSLDDGGTPFDTGDDVWQTYPIDTSGSDALVAVQGDKLWYGDTSGLYLYQDNGWQQVSTEGVTDLVPAQDGALFVGVGNSVLIVEPDGQQSQQTITAMITNNLARVRGATRRNRMWTVAPDGGVWFWNSSQELVRRDDAGVQVYPGGPQSDYIEVDQNNHVWLASDLSLWRMTLKPDFHLEVHPQTWLMTADDNQSGVIMVDAIEGFSEMVTLAIDGLPAGVSATLEPNLVPAGEKATVRLTTAGALLGKYDVVISGNATASEHEQIIDLAVVEHVYDMLLPAIAR